MTSKAASLILGILLAIGLSILGWFIYTSVVHFQDSQRTVFVRGLAEQEVQANIAIWPIKYEVASNNLVRLHDTLVEQENLIIQFLLEKGFTRDEISTNLPNIVDKSANAYSSNDALFRFTGTQTVTVYTTEVDAVRDTIPQLTDLLKEGIAIVGTYYGDPATYEFTELNTIKPDMIAEATKEARAAAVKFAQDSNSKLGKIKHAKQGQFSITPRDSNNPHILKVRVVTSVTYNLID